MGQKNKVTYNKGLNKDISNTKYPQGYYYDLRNGTLLSGDSSDSTEISTIKGNTALFNIPSISELLAFPSTYLSTEVYQYFIDLANEEGTTVNAQWAIFFYDRCPGGLGESKIVGYTHVLDKLVLFTNTKASEDCDAIWTVDFDETLDSTDPGYVTIKLQYISSTLDFDYIGDEAIGKYENENIAHIYFTDNKNTRTFRIDNYDWFFKDPSQLDIVPIRNISKVYLRDVTSTGDLSTGVIQYSYQYYNENGQQSAFSIPSQLVHLTTENENFQETFVNGAIVYKGEEQGVNSGKAVSFYINNIDTRFSRIRLISIFYESNVEDPVIKIISEQNTEGKESIYFTDTGSSNLGSISLTAFRTLGSTPFTAKTIAEKDNILFAGNITEKLFISDNLDNFCTRAYRFDSTRHAVVFDTEDTSSIIYSPGDHSVDIDGTGSIDWLGADDNESEYTVNAYNITTLSDPTKDNGRTESYQYKYMSDGVNLGGTGPNVDFKFIVKRKNIDDLDDSTRSDRVATYTSVDPLDEDVYRDETGIYTSDYKSPYLAGNNRSYQRDDIYRFAVVFFSKEGLVSEAKWIADIRIPPSSEGGSISNYFDIRPYRFSNNECTASIMGIDFRFDFTGHDDLLDEIQGFSIVRAKRDSSRQIQGQGLLSPFIYNWGNNKATGYPIKQNDAIASRIRTNTSIEVDANMITPNYAYTPTLLNTLDALPSGNFVQRYNSIFGFLDHTYTELNVSSDASFYTYGDGDPITDTGYCGFVSPEVLFNKNTTIKYNDRFVAMDAVRTLYYSGASDEVPETDFNWNQLIYNQNNLTATYPSDYPEYGSTNLLKLSSIQEPIATALNSIDITSGEIIEPFKDYMSGVSPFVNGNIRYFNNSTNKKDEFYSNTTLACTLKENTEQGTELKNLIAAYTGGVDYDSTHVLFTTNLKRDNICYGGYTLDNIKNTTYISTGNYISSEGNSNVWFSEIKDGPSLARSTQETDSGRYKLFQDNYTGSAVFGGDTFITMFQYLIGMPTTLTSDEVDISIRGYTNSMTIPVESTINCNLRHDDDMFIIAKGFPARNIGEEKGFRAASVDSEAVTWYYDYTQEKDLYLYNTVYSRDNDSLLFAALKNKDGISGKVINKISASNVKTNGELLDNWTVFGVNASTELSTTEGEIQDLITFKNELYCFQDSGISRLAVNEQSLLQNQGTTLNLGSSGVLPYYQYITKNSGTRHKFSVVATPDTIMYFDTDKNKIYGISSGDGDITTPSGLFSYFRDNIAEIDGSVPSIITTYDNEFKNVHFRITYKNAVSEELIYSTLFNAYTEFRELNPYMYINIPNKYLTFDDITYYLENNGNENTFYGDYKKLHGTLTINPTSNEFIKTLDIIDYMTTSRDLGDANEFAVLNKPLTSIRVYNQYQDTGIIDLTAVTPRNNPRAIQRNRAFRINALRDIRDTSLKNRKSRLRDYYFNIDFVFDKEVLTAPLDTANIKFTLKDLFTSFRLQTSQL